MTSNRVTLHSNICITKRYLLLVCIEVIKFATSTMKRKIENAMIPEIWLNVSCLLPTATTRQTDDSWKMNSICMHIIERIFFSDCQKWTSTSELDGGIIQFTWESTCFYGNMNGGNEWKSTKEFCVQTVYSYNYSFNIHSEMVITTSWNNRFFPVLSHLQTTNTILHRALSFRFSLF